MPTLLLVRHGRTAANAGGTLAGWTPGVGLDETGRAQAELLAQRLGALPVCRVLASPLQRTVETARPLAAAYGLQVQQEEDLGECHYGAWTGQPLAGLAKEELWRTVQRAPSAAVFPASEDFRHESLASMAARAVRAIRAADRQVAADHGEHALWVAVSHGDVIKAIVADALGLHLDEFQRIVVGTASVSILRYHGGARPLVLGVNLPAGGVGELNDLVAPPPTGDAARPGEGVIGGGGAADASATGPITGGDDATAPTGRG